MGGVGKLAVHLISVEQFNSERRVGRECDCPSPVTLVNETEGTWMQVWCKSRRCPVCGPKWKKMAQARLARGIEGQPLERVLFITLTAPGDVDAQQFNENASRYWNHFMVSLKRKFPGAQLDYYRVGEFQKRGHIHFHVVIRGLNYLPHDILQRLAIRAGFGEIYWIKRVEAAKGGIRGLLGYLGKYLLKEAELWPRGKRVVTTSRGWAVDWRPVKRAPWVWWHYVPSVGHAYLAVWRVEEAGETPRAGPATWFLKKYPGAPRSSVLGVAGAFQP